MAQSIVDDIKKYRELLETTNNMLTETTEEGLAGGIVGGAIGGALTKSVPGAATGYKIGSDIQDAVTAKTNTSEEGLNETQEVNIIGYNSAYQPLDQAAKDPKNKRTVTMVKLGIDQTGAPELTFTEDGSNYKAKWHHQYGWVADFD